VLDRDIDRDLVPGRRNAQDVQRARDEGLQGASPVDRHRDVFRICWAPVVELELPKPQRGGESLIVDQHGKLTSMVECAPRGRTIGRFEFGRALRGFRTLEVVTKHRSHRAVVKRQVAEEFIAGETLHALSLAWKR
jgi:hypothetical protein